jgi:hypothetical protein
MYEGKFGYSEELPERIRNRFMWLCQDVANLYSKWDLYITLFGDDENRNILSDTASGSFHLIEESLRNDITISICRLCEERQDTLSFHTLIADTDKSEPIHRLRSDFVDACKPFIRIRHKRLGHADLNTRLEPKENPLPGIGRRNVENALELASRFLNAVRHRYSDSLMDFRPHYYGDGNALLHQLRVARDHWEKHT